MDFGEIDDERITNARAKRSVLSPDRDREPRRRFDEFLNHQDRIRLTRIGRVHAALCASKSIADEKKRSSDRKDAHIASERFSTRIRARIALA
jgi:hypothetical protein